MPTSTGTRACSVPVYCLLFLYSFNLLPPALIKSARRVCVCNRSTCYDLVGMTKEAAEDKQKYARFRRGLGHGVAWTNHEREHLACCQV